MDTQTSDLKRHTISAILTFGSTFLTVFGVALSKVDPTVAITSATISALALTAMRSAVKVAWEAFFQQSI